MASRLTPCPSCSRHVKVGPPSCPFCGGAVPTDVPARTFASPAGKPLTRAALMFAGAAAVTACSSNGPSPTEARDAEADHSQSVAAYGGFVRPDASETKDAAEDHGQAVAHYGGFVSPDAGHETTEDAGHEGPHDGQVVAAYGVFANPDGGHETTEDAGHEGPHDGQVLAAYGVFVNPDGGH